MTSSIDTTPAGCAARLQRIEGATLARRLRESEMALAREIYRRHGIQHDGELLQVLQNVHANCPDSPWRDRLLEIMLDMDAEQPEAEVLGWDKRGEFDGYTQGVKR